MTSKIILGAIVAIAFLAGTMTTGTVVFAETVVFEENFDDTLTGWSESLCDVNNPTQICSLIQDTELRNSLVSPISEPFWGSVRVVSSEGGIDLPIESRFAKSFTISEEGDYEISAWLGVLDCASCVMSSQVIIDGVLVLEKSGVDITVEPPTTTFVSFENSVLPLSVGEHTIEIVLHSTGAVCCDFRASFDDIKISKVTPPLMCGEGTIEVENECLPDTSDDDNDGIPNQFDQCPDDPNKGFPGIEGCGNSDTQPLLDQIDVLETMIEGLEAMIAQLESIIRGESDVEICHKPGTNAEKTKQVNIQQLQGHLKHGDVLGACE